MPTPLPASLAAVIAEAKSPTHLTCGDTAGMLMPILSQVAMAQKQIATHRGKLFASQLEHPQVDGHVERLHQSLNAWEKAVQAMMEDAKRCRLAQQQYERYAREIEKQYAADPIGIATDR
jgi:hypothetical protein